MRLRHLETILGRHTSAIQVTVCIRLVELNFPQQSVIRRPEEQVITQRLAGRSEGGESQPRSGVGVSLKQYVAIISGTGNFLITLSSYQCVHYFNMQQPSLSAAPLLPSRHHHSPIKFWRETQVHTT